MQAKIFPLVFILVAGPALVFAETTEPPDFAFFDSAFGDSNDQSIIKALTEYTVKATPAQEKTILTSLLTKELKPYLFRTFGNRFARSFDQNLRKQYNALIKQLVVADEVDGLVADEKKPAPFEYTNEDTSDSFGASYAFRCLDFDRNNTIDLVLFNQVYFGPSPGLVFYGRNGSAYNHLYDCSGRIVSIEKKANRLLIRYLVTILSETETEILTTISYDFQTKNCTLDSKLYYAQQTTIPKLTAKPLRFGAADAVNLRASPKLDDTKPIPMDSPNYKEPTETATLFGNVVARLAKGSGGYVLFQDKNWAFVAFDSKIPAQQLSLEHGLDPKKQIGEDTWESIAIPQQYYCGWIESKFVKLK